MWLRFSLNPLKFLSAREKDTKKLSNFSNIQFLNDKTYSYMYKKFWKKSKTSLRLNKSPKKKGNKSPKKK